jgi:hypothetical protein
MLTLFDALRLAGSLGMVLFAAAVGIARLAPAEPARREPAPPPAFVSTYGCQLDEPSPCWVDPARLSLERLALPDGDHASHLRAAPWRDERGRTQVVGRWWGALDGQGRLAGAQGPGIARYAFPDGAALERIPTGAVPVSPPCWVPDREAAILYAASDGLLYRLDFGARRADRRPRALRWATPEPGDGPGQIADPDWPTDPRFARTVLISLSTNKGPDGPQRLDPAALWWLRLDGTGTAIEAAGRLDWPGDVDGQGEAEATRQRRFPVVVTRPDGGLTLVCLSQVRRGDDWRLDALAIRVDPEGGAVVPEGPPPRTLAAGLRASTPAPTADGRSVLVMRRDPKAGGVPARISLDAEPGADLAAGAAPPPPAADRS